MPTFEVKVPVGVNQIWMKQQIRAAVAEATRRGKLRPNSVDSITGENSGNNLGPGTPIIHFEQWEQRRHRGEADPQGRRLREHQRAVRAAGGARSPRARRPHARRRAQVHPPRGVEGAGQGLQPRRRRRVRRRRPHVGYLHAKEQLFRTLDDTNPDPRLAEIEDAVMDEANQLTVGPMGFGGKTSLIGCKIGALNRLPASFFVSIAYDCWAFRRLGVHARRATGAITSWLYRDGDDAVGADADAGSSSPPGSRAPAAKSRCRRRSPTSRSARSRSATSSDLRARCSPAATRSTRT